MRHHGLPGPGTSRLIREPLPACALIPHVVISSLRSQRAALLLPGPRSWMSPHCCPKALSACGIQEWLQLFPGSRTARKGDEGSDQEGPLPCPIFQAQPRPYLSPHFSSWQRVIIEFAVRLRMKKENPLHVWDYNLSLMMATFTRSFLLRFPECILAKNVKHTRTDARTHTQQHVCPERTRVRL